MSEKNADGFFETVKTIAFAGLIAIGVRSLAFEPFNIPSGSMKPTLLVGDYLFVSKLSYGYSKHSLPQSLPLIDGRIFFSEPERGDVAVFKLPKDNKTDYIKRIVGLPGDKIQVIRGVLHINDAPVRRRRIADFGRQGDTGQFMASPQFRETLPNGVVHQILEGLGDSGPLDNTGVFLVPKGHYFAMGDNRDNSRDSRFSDVGYVPRENLVGRADVLFFSVDGAGWKFWQWPNTVRSDRVFGSVE